MSSDEKKQIIDVARLLCLVIITALAIALCLRLFSDIHRPSPVSAQQMEELQDELTRIKDGLSRSWQFNTLELLRNLILMIDWWDVALALNMLFCLVFMFFNCYKQCCIHTIIIILLLILRFVI